MKELITVLEKLRAGKKNVDEAISEIETILNGIVMVRNRMNEYQSDIFLNREKAQQYCDEWNDIEGHEDYYIADKDIWGDR